MPESRWPPWTTPLLATLLFAASAEAIDLTGETVVLTYELGNTNGTAMATVGPGAEFVIELVPTSPGFSVSTIDITTDQLTLTHNRSARLGPGLPFIDDDVLVFEFTGLAIDIGDVVLTADPMPEWFGGLTFTDTTITLDQVLDNAGVNESLKVWTIEGLQGDFATGIDASGNLLCAAPPAPPSISIVATPLPNPWLGNTITTPNCPTGTTLVGGALGNAAGLCNLSNGGGSSVLQALLVQGAGNAISCTAALADLQFGTPQIGASNCACLAICQSP